MCMGRAAAQEEVLQTSKTNLRCMLFRPCDGDQGLLGTASVGRLWALGGEGECGVWRMVYGVCVGFGVIWTCAWL
jgi:hypothetical protein